MVEAELEDAFLDIFETFLFEGDRVTRSKAEKGSGAWVDENLEGEVTSVHLTKVG